MHRDKKFLALIPARGGSKGVKDKNIRPLNGQPLIAHSIKAAQKSKIFDEIVVSTDSEIIAEVAKSYGASVPFIRPQHLATDSAKTMDVIVHAIEWYRSGNILFDYMVLLQPTSPLRTEKHIVDAVNLIIDKNANSIVSLTEVDHSPLFSNTLPEDHGLSSFIKREYSGKPRQELPIFYRPNGAIYISKIDSLVNHLDFYSGNSFAYLMDKSSSIDIDDLFDFKFAELLLKEGNRNE